MLKHIIYSIFIIVCCCSTNNINAQTAPGLLGKRLTVTYDFNTHWNYTSPNLRFDDEESGLLDNAFISKHLFGVDYALSRTLSLGLDYGFHQERLDDLYIQNNEYKHRLKSNEIGLRLKYFPIERSGSIAPIGPYLQFRILSYGYLSEMELVPQDGVTPLSEPVIFPYEEGRTTTGSLGFGRQGILFGNIIYNIGCEMALVVTENGLLELEDAQQDVRNSLIIGNLFKLKMGIAVPIF